jgi:hypothetical protein
LTNFSWPSCCKHASGRGLCKHVQSVKTNLLLLQILRPIHLLHRLATPTAAQQSKALHPTLRQLPLRPQRGSMRHPSLHWLLPHAWASDECPAAASSDAFSTSFDGHCRNLYVCGISAIDIICATSNH